MVFNDNIGMFIAHRATATNGLEENNAVFMTASDGHHLVPPRNSVIALEVPWL